MPRRGQSKYINLYPIGHKFGSWELLDPIPVRVKKGNRNHYYYYNVKCECGFEKATDCSQLVSGKTKRCSECGQKANEGSGNPSWKGHGHIPKSRFTRAKYGASQRGIPFEIDIETMNETLDKSGFVCALSGLELDKDSWSLDRIDNSKHYTRDNIQIVHKDVNRMKNKYSEEYFIKLCKKIAEHNQ